MPYGKGRTLQRIQQFIRRKLPKRLVNDLRRLRIVKEADLECAVYYHLRRYIGEDFRWRILARKYSPATGHFVDLLIYDKHLWPVVALELKWNELNIGDKDRESLGRAITRLRIKRTYWISAKMSSAKKKSRLEKNDFEKYRLHRLIVPLGLVGRQRDEWKAKRKQLRS